jgi:hypothetical protein
VPVKTNSYHFVLGLEGSTGTLMTTRAVDPKHLPEDPKGFTADGGEPDAQLDREFTERNKIEPLLRELLDAKRNRESE